MKSRPSPLPAESLEAAQALAAPRGSLELRLARGLLLMLALLLPFETPLFQLGPLQITTVELALYAMLATWGLVVASDVVRGGFVLRTAVGTLRVDTTAQAALLWCAVLFASAMAAPSHRTAALKFALRSLSGVLAFFATRTLARPPEIGRRVLWALAAGALLSAATAGIDWLVPSSAVAWKPFREGNFAMLGLSRASGVFGYPTIGAMYWEAAVPLLIVAPFVAKNARSPLGAKRDVLLAVLGSALLIWAILASATRSGLAGAAMACVALIGLGWRMETGVRSAAFGALCVLALSTFAFGAAGSGSLLGQRLHWWRDESWFCAEYMVDATPRSVQLGEMFTVPVTVRNTGALPWPSAGDHPTRLAYHWEPLIGASTLAHFEGLRTELPADVPPGGTLDIVGTARAPKVEGTYRLRWDLVQEGVTWFSQQGNRMPEQLVEVTSDVDAALSPRELNVAPPTFNPPPPSRSALWRAAVFLWLDRPLLGIGPDNFRRRYEAVLSPSPTGEPYSDTRLHANSLYFETLADLGLAGVAALGLVGLALLRLIHRHWASGCLAGLACGVAGGAFFVHGVLDYFFEFTPLFGLFWVLLGLTAARELAPPASGARRSNTE